MSKKALSVGDTIYVDHDDEFDALTFDFDISDITIPNIGAINFANEPTTRVNFDLENDQLVLTYKNGREVVVPVDHLEKMSVLIDTLEQMEGTELGDLFKTNLMMHRLRGKA